MAFISEKLLKRRPQELGKIKIGKLGPEKTSSGGKKFRLPQKLSHFVVTTRHRGPDGNFVRDDRIHEVLGPEPLELPGILMFETPEENLHAEMLQYKGQSKVWTCDGEEATDLKTGKCGPCPRLQDGDCACKPYVRCPIQLWASPALGYHTLRSTSWETAANLQTALQEIYERFGTCHHAPVKLVLYPAEDSYEEGGQTKTSTSYKVGLVLAMSMEEAAARMVESKKRMELARQELKMLSGQVHQELATRDEMEAHEIAQEFFPDESAASSIATQETLDALKAELGVGQEHQAPEIEAEYEVEDGTEEGESEVEALVKRMRALIDEAPTKGLALTETHLASLQAAMDSRDESHLRTGNDWLETQIAKKQAAPAEGDS